MIGDTIAGSKCGTTEMLSTILLNTDKEENAFNEHHNTDELNDRESFCSQLKEIVYLLDGEKTDTRWKEESELTMSEAIAAYNRCKAAASIEVHTSVSAAINTLCNERCVDFEETPIQMTGTPIEDANIEGLDENNNKYRGGDVDTSLVIQSPLRSDSMRHHLEDGEKWSCDVMKYRENYLEIRWEIQRLSQHSCVLIFCIPQLKRTGHPNSIWRRCCMKYKPVCDNEWLECEMQHKFDDPFNSERMFVCFVPKRHVPFHFYLEEPDTGDFDIKENRKVAHHLLPNETEAHYLLNEMISTLRDGELNCGDRATDIGIGIYFEKARTNKSKYFIHFMNEENGEWMTRNFNSKGRAYFLQSKNLSFVIGNQMDETWLKQPNGCNYYIGFPGCYAIQSNGELIDTQLLQRVARESPETFDMTTIASEAVESDTNLEMFFTLPLSPSTYEKTSVSDGWQSGVDSVKSSLKEPLLLSSLH